MIDEVWCIGCTTTGLPGRPHRRATKLMHTVVADLCTGCELCIPVCPVDCIELIPATGTRTGWQAWSPEQAAVARRRYTAHQARLDEEQRAATERLFAGSGAPPTSTEAAAVEPAAWGPAERRQAIVDAAVARARAGADENG